MDVRETQQPGYEDNVAGRALIEQRCIYQNITAGAPTTTAVKSGAGFLHAIVVNLPVAAGKVELFDNTAGSGTRIGTITIPTGPVAPVTVFYDVAFTTGLTLITTWSGVTMEITVSYR
jgi:hypothetical protein